MHEFSSLFFKITPALEANTEGMRTHPRKASDSRSVVPNQTSLSSCIILQKKVKKNRDGLRVLLACVPLHSLQTAIATQEGVNFREDMG